MTLFHYIVILGVFVSACSQILLKQSAQKSHKHWIYEYLNWRVISAYSIFLLVTFANVMCMKKGVNLKDMPILESLGYIFVPILSYFLLSEKTDKRTLLAMALIVIGIFIFYQ